MIAALAAAETRPNTVTRLLHVEPAAQRLTDRSIDELPVLLGPRDLLVVNDAATLPASLFGRTVHGETIELRLCGELLDGAWRAVLFGAGDWHTPTEARPPPPRLDRGARLIIAAELVATVESVSPLSPRLVELRFAAQGDALWAAIYRHGKPVQYAYEPAPLTLDRVQTPYATRPWAAEMPSAGRPLSLTLLAAIQERGVQVASLTLAAGLSSTGDPAIDAELPLPERYEIPPRTAAAIAATSANGGRVIAVGTTVVRALEGRAAERPGATLAGSGVTDLVISRRHELRVVDGLLSGVHGPDSSHFAVLRAFLPRPLDSLYALHVAAAGYRGHEFGDSTLIL